MSDDTISRKAAIDALRRCKVIDVKNMLIAKDDVMKSIMTLPSAQQWIPVTEQLPKEDGQYLTTNGQGWYEVASYAHQYSDIDAMYELPQDGGGWYIYDSEWGYCVYSSVVAWMHIEPWKGERE